MSDTTHPMYCHKCGELLGYSNFSFIDLLRLDKGAQWSCKDHYGE